LHPLESAAFARRTPIAAVCGCTNDYGRSEVTVWEPKPPSRPFASARRKLPLSDATA